MSKTFSFFSLNHSNHAHQNKKSMHKTMFIIENETAHDVRNRAVTWRCGVRENAWSARDAHYGHCRACHCDDDADGDDGARKILIPKVIGP